MTLPASGGDISYHGASNGTIISVLLLNSLASTQVISSADYVINHPFATSIKLNYTLFCYFVNIFLF